MQVDGQIVTLELPESLIKQYWNSAPDFQQFVQDFRGRNPSVKDLAKKAGSTNTPTKNNSSSGSALASAKKRKLQKDLSGCVVEATDVPAGTTIAEVPVVNARVGGKTDTMPVLVITDGGSYVLNNTTFQVTLLHVFGLRWLR